MIIAQPMAEPVSPCLRSDVLPWIDNSCRIGGTGIWYLAARRPRDIGVPSAVLRLLSSRTTPRHTIALSQCQHHSLVANIFVRPRPITITVNEGLAFLQWQPRFRQHSVQSRVPITTLSGAVDNVSLRSGKLINEHALQDSTIPVRHRGL